MPLSGTFDVLNFPDVLHLLADHQLTGRLHARTRAFAANLFFEDGQLVGADQSDHQVAAVSGDVWGRLEEICFELLDAERGSFEFHLGTGSSAITQRLAVDEVLERAGARLQEWHALQALIPSLELQPRLVLTLDQQEVTLNREQWRMLTAVDGRRNLRAIGRTLNLSDFDVCRMCKWLMDAGVIELEGRAAAVASASMGVDPDLPPVTETVTTVSGRQAVRATSVMPAVDLNAPSGGSPSTGTVRTVGDSAEGDGGHEGSGHLASTDKADQRSGEGGGDANTLATPEAGSSSAGQELPTAPTPVTRPDDPPTPSTLTPRVDQSSPMPDPPEPGNQQANVIDADAGTEKDDNSDDEAEDQEHRRVIRIRSRRGHRKSGES